MDAKYGPGQWRPLQRFLHVQPCGKHRVIDNAKKTLQLHNFHTSLMETITTVNVDFIATVIQQLLSELGVTQTDNLEKFPRFDSRIGAAHSPTGCIPRLTGMC